MCGLIGQPVEIRKLHMLEIATTFAKYKRWEAAEHLEGKRIPPKNGSIPIFMWGNGAFMGIHILKVDGREYTFPHTLTGLNLLC